MLHTDFARVSAMSGHQARPSSQNSNPGSSPTNPLKIGDASPQRLEKHIARLMHMRGHGLDVWRFPSRPTRLAALSELRLHFCAALVQHSRARCLLLAWGWRGIRHILLHGREGLFLRTVSLAAWGEEVLKVTQESCFRCWLTEPEHKGIMRQNWPCVETK